MKGGYFISKLENLSGQRFGKLTVLERDRYYISPSGAHSIMWKCKCDCGNVVSVRGSHLKEGKSKSCGCNGGKLIDITGKRFGSLVVLEKVNHKRTRYKCRCDCGNTVEVDSYYLRHGIANPCQCSKKYHSGEDSATYKHGGSRTRLYGIWQGMLNRCRNSNIERYANYGGRGISVCDEWQDFSAFKEWANSNGYKEDLSIDRVDVNKGYSPDNCRWADSKTQAYNKTTTRTISLNGESHNIAEWAEITGINKGTISSRLNRGWSEERAITVPTGKAVQNG